MTNFKSVEIKIQEKKRDENDKIPNINQKENKISNINIKHTKNLTHKNIFFSNFPTQKQIFVMKNNKNIDAMQMQMNKIIYFKYMSLML